MHQSDREMNTLIQASNPTGSYVLSEALSNIPLQQCIHLPTACRHGSMMSMQQVRM